MNSARIPAQSLPRISIVTPSFNQGRFLEQCINSVIAQNYPNFEYIILDGGSTDESVAIIKKYEKYLTYWQSKPDGGQYTSIEDGFRMITGEIMAWLNSDDMYHDNAFWKVAYIFSNNSQVDWVTSRHLLWDERGGVKYVNFTPPPKYSRERYLTKGYDNPFIMQEGTFWRRSLWEKAGACMRTDLEFAGDLELWVRFFRHAQLYVVDTFLGGYRLHGNQKVQLFPDLYRLEAEKIILSESSLFASDRSVQLPAPDCIHFNIEEFFSFVREFDPESSKLIGSLCSEYLKEYLFNEHEKLINSLRLQSSSVIRGILNKVRREINRIFEV